MRAVAGVAHSTVKTKTVTQLCVYVDKKDGGDSYGDLSVDSKYGHKTCIVGKRGPAGDSSVVTWNKTVATATVQQVGAKHRAGGTLNPGTVLASVGPFTVRGYCTSSDGVVRAVTDVVSAQDGSSFVWGSESAGNFNNGDDLAASNAASSDDPSDPDWANENDSGDFSVSTADNTTSFTGSANNGVYMNGESGPNCSFSGYVVVEKPSS